MEAESRAKGKAEIWEKSEKTRKAKSKADAETVERARAWAKAKDSRRQRSPESILRLFRGQGQRLRQE